MNQSLASSPTAIAERFLRALSRLDLDAMFEEIAPDVTCTFPTAPERGPREIRGRDTNRAFFSALRPIWVTFSLTRIDVHPLADDSARIVAEFASDGSLVDGSPYQNTYLALGRVRNGKIQEWQEFSDPAPLLRGLAALQAATPAG